MGFPCGSAGKESACNAGDLGSVPGLGRSPGEGKGYPLQYSGLENYMDGIVHGLVKRWTLLSNFHFHMLSTLMVIQSYCLITKAYNPASVAKAKREKPSLIPLDLTFARWHLFMEICLLSTVSFLSYGSQLDISGQSWKIKYQLNLNEKNQLIPSNPALGFFTTSFLSF